MPLLFVVEFDFDSVDFTLLTVTETLLIVVCPVTGVSTFVTVMFAITSLLDAVAFAFEATDTFAVCVAFTAAPGTAVVVVVATVVVDGS